MLIIVVAHLLPLIILLDFGDLGMAKEMVAVSQAIERPKQSALLPPIFLPPSIKCSNNFTDFLLFSIH
ncbi:hypothetical protein Scep_011524 [Stephania cephalantha]|uniref:Uncharacterized protein n=1 Tax=Stephania cephalantha TaxID=152367 RepID=A0AAP0P903_9MAGN